MDVDGQLDTSPIVELNVGGTRFSTSKETLTWVPESFFHSLFNGHISSYRDHQGAIFIDRDPKLFSVILNFLRSKQLHLEGTDIKALRHEAEFFGVIPLVNRLLACEQADTSSCGNVYFHGMLQCPAFPETPVDSTSNVLKDTTKNNSIGSAPQSDIFSNKVCIITGHNSWIAVAYSNYVICYKVKESSRWQQVFISPYLPGDISRLAINTKVQGMAPDSKTRMVAVAFTSHICLWSFEDEVTFNEVGVFDMNSKIDALFFIGSQLVSCGKHLEGNGRVGVWNAVSQHWQTQDIVQITSHDTAGTYLLLGGANGAIYYIDMQKFPLRLKDNDLLITELYRDTSNSAITALSVYLTPKNSITAGNWIEVAYGTTDGAVCVIVQHPELVGQGFQLFQTFTVHRSPVVKVMLSEKHLVSVCSDDNHVRTWTVNRFRGMISTQPGSKPLASFSISSMEPMVSSSSYFVGNDIGPHGEREDTQIFVQKFLPYTDTLYVRASSTGHRVAEVKSVDSSPVTCFCLHECEGSSRMGARPRSYLFTGHGNGTIQIWDMSTALGLSMLADVPNPIGGPTQNEMLELLSQSGLALNQSYTFSDSRQASVETLHVGVDVSKNKTAKDVSTSNTNLMHKQLNDGFEILQLQEASTHNANKITRKDSEAVTLQSYSSSPGPSNRRYSANDKSRKCDQHQESYGHHRSASATCSTLFSQTSNSQAHSFLPVQELLSKDTRDTSTNLGSSPPQVNDEPSTSSSNNSNRPRASSFKKSAKEKPLPNKFKPPCLQYSSSTSQRSINHERSATSNPNSPKKHT